MPPWAHSPCRARHRPAGGAPRAPEASPGTEGAGPLRPPPTAAALLVAGLLVASACGEPGPAGPGEAGLARLVTLEAPAGSVAVDGGSSPFAVRAEDGDGRPLPGVDVRFLVRRGPGSVQPPSVRTDSSGRAGATYVPGARAGDVEIRVDAPAAAGVPPLLLSLRVIPGARVHLERLAGDEQTAEAGSQLPRPFRLRVVDGAGDPVPEVAVTWSVRAAPEGAELTVVDRVTDAGGRSEALLTLGGAPGAHEVVAHAASPAASDTVRFRATAVDGIVGDLRLDSVTPRPLVPGARVTLHGSGLAGVSPDVRVEGRRATVLEAVSDRIEIRVPEEEPACRPERTVGLRVLRAGSQSNGLTALLRPGAPLGLAPGESVVRAGPEAACTRLAPAGRGTEYRLVIQSAARADGALAFRAAVRRGRSASRVGTATAGEGAPGARAAPFPTRVPAGAGPAPFPSRRTATEAGRGPVPGNLAGPGAPAPEPAAALRERARTLLMNTGAVPVRARSLTGHRAAAGTAGRTPGTGTPAATTGGRAVPATGHAAAADAPAPGALLRFRFAVGDDLSLTCEDAGANLVAAVREVNEAVVLAEDTLGAGAGFSDEELGRLAAEFRDVVFPTGTSYFGAPADIDGNGRVVVLLTPRVNRLTPRDAPAAVGGFFLPLDLAESGRAEGDGVSGPGGATCPASNEAEILYLRTADPTGRFGPEFPVPAAMRNARGIMAHELEHLLSAEQRVVLRNNPFAAIEEVWLGEGMSHVAEEAVGLAAAGFAPGQNLDLDRYLGAPGGHQAFNTYHLQNFGRLQLYLADPGPTPALTGVDPGGIASLRMRGFAWLLLRWLADRAGPAAGPGFFRTLSAGGPGGLTGIANLEEATGTPWEEILAGFGAVPLLDDRALAGGEGLREASQVTTWDLPGLYGQLSRNPAARQLFPFGYPLAVRGLPTADTAVALELRPGAAVYLGLGDPLASPALSVGLTEGGGDPLRLADLRVRVLRLR